jgi:addiction module RelE/StbE family toxin
MVEITWTTRAKTDLKHIHKYVSFDSVLYADRLILKLIARVDILERLPLSGKIVREKNDETIRELVHGNYRIFYKIKGKDSIHILRIYRSSMNIK